MEPSGRAIASSLERRQTLRLLGPFAVTWAIASQQLTGTGVIQDLSTSGICLQLDREFRVQPGVLLLSLKAPEIALLPAEAKLRWFRRPAKQRYEKPRGFLCGCVFVSPTAAWTEWYAQAVARQVAGVAGGKV